MTCVRCGYCCRKAPCPYGEGVPCVHLVADPNSTAGQYLCARHDEIRADPQPQWSPAFDAGCSSALFNSDRDTVRVALRLGE